jgi:hypothetical protein
VRGRKAVGVYRRPVIAATVDVPRRVLAHGKHAVAGVEGIREASPVIVHGTTCGGKSVSVAEFERSAI